jgi:hypothetical protein
VHRGNGHTYIISSILQTLYNLHQWLLNLLPNRGSVAFGHAMHVPSINEKGLGLELCIINPGENHGLLSWLLLHVYDRSKK